MSEKGKTTVGSKKAYIILGTVLIVLSLATSAYFLYPLFKKETVEGNLAALSENFESLSETGLMLVNQGGFNPEESTIITSSPQINFFEDGGLSKSSGSEAVYKFSTNISSESVIEKFENLGLDLELSTDETVSSNGFKSETYRNVSDSDYYFLRITFKQQGRETMEWEYNNDIINSSPSWCPELTKPVYENYKNPGVSYEDLSQYDLNSLTESQLSELINIELYKTDLSKYELDCGDFEEKVAEKSVFEATAEEFLNVIGLNTETLTYLTELEEPYTTVKAYQKIGSQNVAEVAEFKIIFDGTSIASAKGLQYEVIQLGNIETLSPAESIFRTKPEGLILGKIDPKLYEDNNIISLNEPSPGDTYSLNESKKILVASKTVDGIYIFPGYLLTDTTKKVSIYTVALKQEAFMPF